MMLQADDVPTNFEIKSAKHSAFHGLK